MDILFGREFDEFVDKFSYWKLIYYKPFGYLNYMIFISL